MITVTAGGRERSPPTATRIVWADAEGFGVGPDQRDGRHGLSLTINPQPLAGELGAPIRFAEALAAAKTAYPALPAWLTRVLEATGPAVETACAATHTDPFVVRKLTAADARK